MSDPGGMPPAGGEMPPAGGEMPPADDMADMSNALDGAVEPGPADMPDVPDADHPEGMDMPDPGGMPEDPGSDVI